MKGLILTVQLLLLLAVGIEIAFCVNVRLERLFQQENEELAKLLKREVDAFRVDMTKSFMTAHTRRKRALVGGTVTDLSVAPKRFIEAVTESVGPFSTFVFDGKPYLIKRDGIYEISDLLDPASKSVNGDDDSGKSSNLKLVGEWNLAKDEIVLNGFEWKHTFFLLTTKGTFSSIYTMHEHTLKSVRRRQRIFNKGNAVAGQFFEHRRNLFLVLCNDNEIHSTTFSAIFRWAGSYMDEIHQVQTTGATAVETFTINSKKYIAIAQAQDSSENMELGTIVLSMNQLERLERVQLLWSHGARDLQYMSTEKEHFLVIGQEKESSIVYWFGGMDFIYWQQFDGLQGNNLFLSGLQLSADDPVLIASDGGQLRIFTRSTSSTSKLMTTWVQSKTFDSRITTEETISKAKFLRVTGGSTQKESLFLVTTNKLTPGSEMESLKIFPVGVVQREVGVDSRKDPGDSLSDCMHSLETSLDDSRPILDRITDGARNVLRTDKNFQLTGILETDKALKMKAGKSKVRHAHIAPASRSGYDYGSGYGSGYGSDHDTVKTTPSKLLSDIKASGERLQQLKSSLDNIIYKSDGRKIITGNLKFLGSVQFESGDSTKVGDLKVNSINGIKWNELQTAVLTLNSPHPQRVTGEWTMDSIQADNVFVENTNSKLSPNSFLLRTCPTSQTATGVHKFTKNLNLGNSVGVSPDVTVNNILFSDVVLKGDKNVIVKGFKHAPVVTGTFTTTNVNDKNIREWFASVAKLEGDEEQHFTGELTFTDQANLKIGQLTVQNLNSKEWDSFQNNVLVNGVDQEIKGFVMLSELNVEQIEAGFISGMRSEELLTYSGDQQILSNFRVENVMIDGELSTVHVNGARLEEAVNRNQANVVIDGPVLLENCNVHEISVPDGVTVAGKDVSELAKLNKVHVYTAGSNKEIILKEVNADNIQVSVVNGKILDELKTKYWSSARDNVVGAAEIILSDRLVTVQSGNFKTGFLSTFKFPEEFISLEQSTILIKTAASFEKPVLFHGNVTMVDGATVENIDVSGLHQMIVDDSFQGAVRGTKTFAKPIFAKSGASFENLNGVNPKDDVIMLLSNKEQVITGSVQFLGPVNAKTLTVEEGDVAVTGAVNGLNLEEVGRTTAYKDQDNVVDGHVTFLRRVQAGKFSTEILNGVNVAEVVENLVFLRHSNEQVLEGDLELEDAGVMFSGSSITQQINGIPVFGYMSNIVRLDSPGGLIKGTKTFTNADLKGHLSCSTVNDVDLEDVEEHAFSKTKPQTVTGNWTLENVDIEENLRADEIGGVPFSDLVFINEPFEVNSPVTFESSGGSIQGPLIVEGLVNGIKFDDGLKHTVALSGIKSFERVTINGNLNWDEDQQELERLSYFFSNAVEKTGPQIVSGRVTFLKGLKTAALSSPDKWLNGVNLKDIQDDALMKSDGKWVLTGKNTFRGPLTIKRLMNSVTTLNVEEVDGRNLLEMDRDIYKSSDGTERVIKGSKVFNGDVSIKNLDIEGQWSELDISELVTQDDPRKIKQVHLKDAAISKDILWENAVSSDFSLASLLTDRVSLTKDGQELQGPFTFEAVSVGKSCKVPTINSVNVKNTISRDVSVLPPISGSKVFSNSLTVEGEVDSPSLNSHTVDELLDKTLRVDRKEVITRPVIFENPVVVRKPVQIESLNDLHLKNFDADVSQKIGKIMREAESPEALAKELSGKETILRRTAKKHPGWLDYLRLKQDMSLLGSKSKVEHVKRANFGDILITFHHESGDVEGVGLPKGCGCNVVNTLKIEEDWDQDGNAVVEKVGVDNCLRVFNVEGGNENTYTVASETFSTNASCISAKDRTTRILAGKKLIGEMQMGHLSDVGIFSESGTDYLVLAQYFDKSTRSHSTTTKIMRIGSNGALQTVQDIRTHGAKKVALEKVNNLWMLGIANSKTSADQSSCSAESEIYTWSGMTQQFVLLRSVMTDGAFDLEFITTQTGNEFYRQSFVAFAQQGNSGSGEVVIFRFEQLGGNFVMSQTIRSNWPISSLRKVSLCGQQFLVTAVPQEGVTFYENRFVEGFQEYYNAPVSGATDVTAFTVNGEEMLAIATNKGPFLAQAVMTGSSCSNLVK